MVRSSALAFARWAEWKGVEYDASAELLGMHPATLRRWRRDWRSDRLPARPRGRPAERASARDRAEVIGILDQMGVLVGVPRLQALFPGIAKREIEDLLARYRRLCWRRSGTLVQVLTWTKPGTVWAMDFTEPPTPVDGIYPYILAVRDLASGCQLAALPCDSESAFVAVAVLSSLFAEHGRPLVIKSDNGSAFISAEVAGLLESCGVVLLLSPPHTPRYNGSCEAGIGSVKTRAHHIAAAHGRPGEWTCDDVEAARMQVNETGRPHGHLGPTPSTLWEAREAVTEAERHAFSEAVRRMEPEARMDLDLPATGPLGRRDAAAVARISITRALVAHGLLELRRRRITPHINRRFRNFIS